ncbi:MAG TPA: dynamin family protein [Candidatus Acidoferrales bacterium]|nr:dynamin family protein [Candidatus Acidoferrales bacterium]
MTMVASVGVNDCRKDAKIAFLMLVKELHRQLSLAFPDLLPRVEIIEAKISDEQFNLVVVGQFKRGKSTLINALLGKNILPAAVVPLTSIITILHYGTEEKITVSFTDAHTEVVERERLPQYVTEKLNPENSKNVEQVDIEFPGKFLEGGVYLVDTPGVGSIYAHNTDTANHFLPESDATIFLMTADQPLSIGEVEFLRNVREHVTKIFFVLNKVDLLSEAERNEAAAFIKDSLSKEMSVPQDSIKLFLVSSKFALLARESADKELEKKSNFEFLESALTNFLSKEKEDVMLDVASRRAQRIVVEASALARLRLKGYSQSIGSLQKKIEEFRKFKKEIQKRQQDVSRVIYTAYNITTMIEEDALIFKGKTQPEVERRFEEIAAKNKHLRPTKLIDALDKAIIQLVTKFVDKWRYEEEAKVKDKFNAGVDEFFSRMNELINDVYQHAAELFDVEFQRVESYPLFSDETEFYYFILEDIKPSLEELSDAIVRRLPRAIAKGLILRKQRETLKIEFDRQCGRVRYDFIKRIDKSMMKLGKTSADTVNDHVEKIDKIIADAMAIREKTSTEVSARIAEYEETLSKLTYLGSKFAKLES